MFGLFTKRRRQTDPVTVEQIHAEFNTAADKALASAKSIIDGTDKDSINKGKRLKQLGFGSTKEVRRTDEEGAKMVAAAEKAKVITDYQQKYPNNKFISKEDVVRICEKYRLVCGPVGRFTGFVPEKNLQQIEAFKCDIQDMPLVATVRSVTATYGSSEDSIRKILARIFPHELPENESYRNHMDRYDVRRLLKEKGYTQTADNISDIRVDCARDNNFLICAPVSDFDTKDTSMGGGFITLPPPSFSYKQDDVPDPVVLQKVKGGYLIVTAWGEEASDPLIVNEKMN